MTNALFSLPNDLFCVDNARRIYILIKWLGLKGLMKREGANVYMCVISALKESAAVVTVQQAP